MDNKKLSFEEALSRLEIIVKSLESGNTPLDKSIALFEEGVKLSAYCNELLVKAEQKVTMLVKNNDGKIKEEDFLEAKKNKFFKKKKKTTILN